MFRSLFTAFNSFHEPKLCKSAYFDRYSSFSRTKAKQRKLCGEVKCVYPRLSATAGLWRRAGVCSNSQKSATLLLTKLNPLSNMTNSNLTLPSCSFLGQTGYPDTYYRLAALQKKQQRSARHVGESAGGISKLLKALHQVKITSD